MSQSSNRIDPEEEDCNRVMIRMSVVLQLRWAPADRTSGGYTFCNTDETGTCVSFRENDAEQVLCLQDLCRYIHSGMNIGLSDTAFFV